MPLNYTNQESTTQDDPQSPATESKTARYAEQVNIAEDLDEDKLRKLGMDAKKGFEDDEASRRDWLDQTYMWQDMAKQVRDIKNWPWPNASNVKYPLISTAAMQFAARSYPTLIPSDGQIVKSVVIGVDRDGTKTDRGAKVEKFMSWQLMHDMKGWEADMDRLLIMLAVNGMMFKKVYYDATSEKPIVEVVYPENFVIDYWAKEIESAERFSEIMYVSPRVLKERQAQGLYLNIDLGTPIAQPPATPTIAVPLGVVDETTPYKLIVQARWEDLDDDGIKEPYYVVFHAETGKVLRVYARFDTEDIQTNAEGDVVGFKPTCHYIKYPFIPNPDGSFYDLGFGHLLGPLNEAVNTTINQLIDAGTLATTQGGFIGKGLRLKMGDTPIAPGEWKVVNAIGDDLRKQIVPLPFKEPSNVLFELLGMLVQSGKELASVAEIFVGKMPGQNTPATTTMASIEQGMKVFTAIYKRIYRALNEEFKSIFKINGKYLDAGTAVQVLDDQIGPEDFDYKSYDICPAADPQAASQTEKMTKAQSLLSLLQLGTLDPLEVTKRILIAQDQPNWQELIRGMKETGQPAPPPPDPKMQEIQMKMQAEQQKIKLKAQEMQNKAELEKRTAEQKMMMEQQMHQQEMQQKSQMAQLDGQVAMHKAKADMMAGTVKAESTLQQAQAQGKANELTNSQKLQHGEENHQQKMKQAKETAKSKPKTKPQGKRG
jgi:chaperonin GroES